MDEQTSRERETSRTVTLTEAPDIVATIGRPGLLEQRATAGSITRLSPMRSDTLLEYVQTHQVSPGALITSLHPDLLDPDPLDPGETLDCLSEVSRLLAENETTLFVYTVSTYDPSQRVHRFVDVPDTFSMRAHRLLAGLEHRAGETGIKVIDADGAVAEVGGAETVPAPGELTGAVLDFLTDEAVQAIDQSGALGNTLQAPVMRLIIPSVDRRTKLGTLTRWHAEPGSMVTDGDQLFDFRYESRVHRFDMGHEEETSPERRGGRSKKAERVRTIDVTVVAGSDAYLREIILHEGAAAGAGDVAAVLATAPDSSATLELAGGDFRVGTRTVE